MNFLKPICIDLGIADFAVLSNGRKIDNQTFTTKMGKKLKSEPRVKSPTDVCLYSEMYHKTD